jgi:hypothetical protein
MDAPGRMGIFASHYRTPISKINLEEKDDGEL